MMSKNEQPPAQAQLADEMPVINKKRQRIWEIDFFRGVCVLLMILDHLAMLIGTYFGPQWYGSKYAEFGRGDAFSSFCYNWVSGSASGVRDIIHPIVLFVFFSISGISCILSRNNLKRGFQLLVVAIIYSIGSYIAQDIIGISGVFVLFGVLDFLAVSMLLYAFVAFACRNNRWAIIGVSAALIIVTLCLYFLYTPPATTPKFLCIIFPQRDFWGNRSPFYNQYEISPGDMFPMIPWTAFYFAGVLLGQLFYTKKKSLLEKMPLELAEGKLCEKIDSDLLAGKPNALHYGFPVILVASRIKRVRHAFRTLVRRPVCFVGRYALIIYVVHVVALAGIVSLISGLFITPGNFGF